MKTEKEDDKGVGKNKSQIENIRECMKHMITESFLR